MSWIPNAIDRRVNGISIAALTGTVNAMRQNRSFAQYQFRVRNQWLDAGRSRTTAKGYYGLGKEQATRPTPLVIESDAPTLLADASCAMDPLEQLLSALAASVTATLVWQAAANRIYLDSIEVAAEGDFDVQGALGLDTIQKNGFSAIRLLLEVEADVPDAMIEKLVELATRNSPVFNTIQCGTTIAVEVRKAVATPD